MNNISRRKRSAGIGVVNDVTCPPNVLLHVWSYNFYDTTLSSAVQKEITSQTD